MKIFGRNHVGPVERSTKPRKRTTPTKIERRLQKRVESYNTWRVILERRGKGLGPNASGYHRPGALK